MKSDNIIKFIDNVKTELKDYFDKNSINDLDIDMNKYNTLKTLKNHGPKKYVRQEKMLFRIFTLIIVIFMFINIYLLYYTINNPKVQIVEKKINIIKDKEIISLNKKLLETNNKLRDINLNKDKQISKLLTEKDKLEKINNTLLGKKDDIKNIEKINNELIKENKKLKGFIIELKKKDNTQKLKNEIILLKDDIKQLEKKLKKE